MHVMSGRQRPHSSIGGYNANESFHWLHPALFSTLFSDFHGLFFWSPVLLLSVIGFIWYFTRRGQRFDGLLVSLLISLAALWYLNSAWYAWSSVKHSAGGRLSI